MVTARVEQGRLLDQLAAVGAVPGSGITRLAWSPADRRAVALVGHWAAEAGAASHVDAVGSLVADLPGTDAWLAPLALGSHLDTVVAAGHLDGAYGVVAAVEVLAALADAGIRLRHPLRVAAFANEEGVVAPAFTGSRAAAGVDLADELVQAGPDGVTLADRLAGAGGDPAAVPSARWGPLSGFVELHIEQGPVLHDAGRRTGVVAAITGQRRARVEVTGQANHAGTTPMALRRDALVAAARAVLAVEELATSGRVAVATVGSLRVRPDVGNVVPGQVDLTVDLRSIDDRRSDEAVAVLAIRLARIGDATGTRMLLTPTATSSAVGTDGRWRAVLHSACAAEGVPAIEMPSGAGHDAGHMAALGPMGMLFVPSIDGVSHHPAEATSSEDLALGARVLLAAVVEADRQW